VTRILIVEDEERISSFVAKGLRAAGFVPEVVADGKQGLAEAITGAFDLVLLDVGLPSMDGFEVLRRLRAVDADLPVIMLTARTGVQDTVSGLELGANDYVAKPFRFDELMARIRVRLRDADRGSVASDVLTVGEVDLDLHSRRARVGERAVDLSAREFALAEELMRHAGQVLSREQLLSRVWGIDFDPGSNVVEVYIGYLRGKLGADAIETVRGMGYRFRN